MNCHFLRHVAGRDQDMLAVLHHRDRFHADRLQETLLQIFRERGCARARRGKGRDRRRLELLIEPHIAEIGDRRHVDQHLRDHDEGDRQHEKLAGQPSHRPQLGKPRLSRHLLRGLFLKRHQTLLRRLAGLARAASQPAAFRPAPAFQPNRRRKRASAFALFGIGA